jgi:hypothetical protein
MSTKKVTATKPNLFPGRVRRGHELAGLGAALHRTRKIFGEDGALGFVVK